jgi:hypothetical protein
MQAPPENMDTYNITIKIGFLEISGRQNIGVYTVQFHCSVGYYFELYSVYDSMETFHKSRYILHRLFNKISLRRGYVKCWNWAVKLHVK